MGALAGTRREKMKQAMQKAPLQRIIIWRKRQSASGSPARGTQIAPVELALRFSGFVTWLVEREKAPWKQQSALGNLVQGTQIAPADLALRFSGFVTWLVKQEKPPCHTLSGILAKVQKQ